MQEAGKNIKIDICQRRNSLYIYIYWCLLFYLIECSPGYYGDECNEVCGKCASSAACDSRSGDCPGECVGNWQKPKCTGKKFINQHVFKVLKCVLFFQVAS